MKNKFLVFQIEIFDKAKSDQMVALGLEDTNVPCEICDVYIDISRIESFRKSYIYGNDKVDCTSVTMHSGDSYCLIISMDEFIKRIDENN